MREQRPRPEREDREETDYADSASEGYDDRLQLWYTRRESQPTTEENRRVSGNASGDEGRVTERDGASATCASDPLTLNTAETDEINEGQHRYLLRPRVQRNYKE
jgi:hypothetical protein